VPATNLKKAGLKVTVPRLKILSLFQEKPYSHLSAEQVYKTLHSSGEDIGLATVYRVLTQFEEAGIVVKHNFEANQSVFELQKGDHHDHLVCVKCGLIMEFCDEVIESRQETIAKEKNFRMETHTHCIYGVCENCQD